MRILPRPSFIHSTMCWVLSLGPEGTVWNKTKSVLMELPFGLKERSVLRIDPFHLENSVILCFKNTKMSGTEKETFLIISSRTNSRVVNIL